MGRRAWRDWWSDLSDGLLDRRCPGCLGRPPRGREVCDACDALVARTGTALCLSCMRGDSPSDSKAGTACPKHGSGSLLLAGPPYEPPLDRIVRAFKYEGAHRLAGWVSSLLPEPPFLDGPLRRECVLVPVALHPARRAERGFDQALLLATAVSPRWGIPVLPALERTRNHPPQARFDAERRRANVRGAFRATEPALVRGRTVLLVDDVATTGSTLLEASAALTRAGAAWVLAISASHGGAGIAPGAEALQPVAGSKAVW